MKNENHFGTLTERMQAFREEVLDEKPYVDAERAIWATEAYRESLNQPRVMVRALMLQKILEHMTVYIEDKSLLAGNQATKNRNAPVFPEYTLEFVMNELDLFEKRDGDVFYITEETKEQLRSIAPFWENNNLRARGEALLPDEVSVFMETGLFGMEGKLNAGDAHLAVNYERLLKEGLRGYEAKARACKEALDLTDPDSIDKNVFYKAVLIVIEAVRAFALRYSELAADLAARESDAARKAELLEMSRICAKVPYEPASNFREAVQSVWFIQLILQIESNGHSLSYGRFDQYMDPYYEKSLQDGTITREEALELLTCLWIKTLTINKVRSQAHTLSSAGSPMYQNVTIGGQTVDKKDAVNPLSFLVLQSVAQTRLTQPNLTVRYHANLDPKFFDECIEVMKLGFGMPALNNDEIIIPSFIQWGVKEEDAYNYSAIGCVETAVPGKWGYRCTGMSYINFPRLLLCVMNDGVDLTSGKRFVKGYGHFQDMESYEELLDAWDKSLRELTRYSVIVENAIDKASERDVPDILCSALTDDCIGRGKTIKEGGAVYDFISGLQVGIANMADSLAAVKKLVYDEKKITRDELWNAILDDFQSPENQKIQEMLINDAPKYGNDNDDVDLLVVRAYDTYIDEIKKYPSTRYHRGPIGGIRYAGTSSISANVGQGMGTMATPDGRHAFEPLAEGCSPAHNCDKNGPTAVFKTVSKLPTDKITGGVLLNQKMTPQVLSREENKQKLEMLIRTFFNRLHGYHVQYNIVSRETLIDAQLHPEKHKDLIVRVAGYSAFFNVLSKKTQDDIIGRTEQSL
ncbi:glycyl radical protein [Laedolimicola ammoniilytica]|uniref:Glycyl radical protein n=1 Tax=Laedolimicola ammoniilytica TaxID=2981771 RepID=A0ABT2RYU1_9FIRM|nr:glycyl radical protein [Laedolimicola ammoniilytica]MCU6697433.1 glycyl radical protein [Laedolimicola ammoniilytica]SCI26917.1 4-hydroxyphenylacetate decarboxylase large subunit [uncultured Clostridium sp.]